MIYKLTDEFVWKEIGNKVVILQFDTGIYWTLNDSASLMWRHLVDGRTIEETAETLMNEFDIEADSANLDIAEFVKTCIEKKMLASG